jgi:hypothetical protein
MARALRCRDSGLELWPTRFPAVLDLNEHGNDLPLAAVQDVVTAAFCASRPRTL